MDQGGHLDLVVLRLPAGERPKYEPHFHAPVQGVVIGDNVQAETFLQESLKLARQVKRWELVAEILAKWGELYLQKGQWNLAKERFGECLSLAEQVGVHEKREEVGAAYYGLARVAAAQGNIAEARQQGLKSLAIFQAIGHHKATEVREWLDRLHMLNEGAVHYQEYKTKREE